MYIIPSVGAVSLRVVTISFSLTRPLYSLDRLRYLPANIDYLTSNGLLLGCENQSDDFDESLFLKVQELLIRSGRFGRSQSQKRLNFDTSAS